MDLQTLEDIIVYGGRPLSGSVSVSGAKNAVLPILAASLLAKRVDLSNVPHILDVDHMLDILAGLGVQVEARYPHVRLVCDELKPLDSVTAQFCREIRYAILLVPILASRFGSGHIPLPGGCAIGRRPIDQHIAVLNAFGIETQETQDALSFDGSRGFNPAQINLEIPSVGATEQALICAALARGESVITGCALEPEVQALAEFLVELGCEITETGYRQLTVQSNQDFLRHVSISIIPDRIEAATYLMAAFATQSQFTINGINPDDLKMVLDELADWGCKFEVGPDHITWRQTAIPDHATIETRPYPGFPTDIQPLLTAALAAVGGTCRIAELIFPERIKHVEELIKLGGSVTAEPGRVWVTGEPEFSEAQTAAHDLRTGAALMIMALANPNRTVITNSWQILRGYDRFIDKLRGLGADIQTWQQPEQQAACI